MIDEIDEDEYDKYIDYLKIFKTHLEKLHILGAKLQTLNDNVEEYGLHKTKKEISSILYTLNDAINKIRWIEFKELPKDEN